MARARMMAELGYVALAADMFGDRRQARNLQEVANLVGAFATTHSGRSRPGCGGGVTGTVG
jgi:dienelactone hydrolase